MEPLVALGLVLALVAVATGAGLAWRARQGRVSLVGQPATGAPGASTAWVISPADVSTTEPFGSHATLLQFSTELCARCPGTHRLLQTIATSRDGVVHLDIDLTRRSDVANRFNILQTPTTLILDGTGRIQARVSGVPNREHLASHLDELMRSHHVNISG
ncbi:TlpA family protein disulfide reductase [Glaciibacter superstes]|uniref:TlpA family protein disulfide reductase n=1 Tax=Glaciibacter superstes TaxID=501023 RepID=UPI0003B5A319|nr:thioredoxin family protein [Glaciibacter superstes]